MPETGNAPSSTGAPALAYWRVEDDGTLFCDVTVWKALAEPRDAIAIARDLAEGKVDRPDRFGWLQGEVRVAAPGHYFVRVRPRVEAAIEEGGRS